MNNIRIANIKTTFKSLFKQWLLLTKSMHKLTPNEIDVLSLYLYYFYVYKEDIKNEGFLWKILFDYETKLKIRDELNIDDGTFQNIMTAFRKKQVIVDNKINPKYIPILNTKEKSFKIIFNLNYE